MLHCNPRALIFNLRLCDTVIKIFIKVGVSTLSKLFKFYVRCVVYESSDNWKLNLRIVSANKTVLYAVDKGNKLQVLFC